jgi:DNA-binding CsgD family transcriptional regulator
MGGLGLVTPGLVTRTFRSLLVNSLFNVAMPEMGGAIATVAAAGCADALAVNGLDPSGLGVTLFLWGPDRVAPTPVERDLFLRLSHHLGAAYRCRRRLRESQLGRTKPDPTEGAEAILDARRRIVHAVGPAQTRSAQADIRLTATARERARVSGARSHDPFAVVESLRGWRPLTRARWTLVDSFEQGGARYVVARENQSRLQGLERLTDRERQAVAYLSVGQSTKETAYALGISDTTVRVLLSRAAKKLGVRSRAALLAHDEVRRLRPDKKTPVR